MDRDALKAFVAQHDAFEIRVIEHSGNRFYQIELEDVEGQRHRLTQAGKPVLFRSLDDVYLELKRADIHRAYLVECVPEEDMSRLGTAYPTTQGGRMPLDF